MPIKRAVKSGSGLSGASYYRKVFQVAGVPLAYWPLWETLGTDAGDISGNSRDGTYSSDVSTWPPVSGIGDGNNAPFFDGTNDYTAIHSVSLAGAFNGSEGTISLWSKVASSNVWTDGTARHCIRLFADGDNQIDIRKQAANNTMRWRYEADGAAELVELASITTVGWMHLAITWSLSQDEMIAYFQGAQTGVTQTGLGTWAGALVANQTLVGAGTTGPATAQAGPLAHVILYDSALSASQIAALGSV